MRSLFPSQSPSTLLALLLACGALLVAGPGCKGDEPEESSASEESAGESGDEDQGAKTPDEDPAEAKAAPEAASDDKAAAAAKEDANAEGEAPAAAGQAKDDRPLDASEKRRKDREDRIAKLKRRNEERRQERLNKHASKNEGAAVAGTPPPAPAEPKRPVLDVARFLPVKDLRTLTGERTLAAKGQLAGIPATETYNSAYFAPSKRSEFGVSLQVWKERIRRDVNQRFERMRADFPNAEDTTAIGPKGFISYYDDIVTLTFADLSRRVVASVSCSQKICTGEQLLSVANAVNEKL